MSEPIPSDFVFYGYSPSASTEANAQTIRATVSGDVYSLLGAANASAARDALGATAGVFPANVVASAGTAAAGVVPGIGGTAGANAATVGQLTAAQVMRSPTSGLHLDGAAGVATAPASLVLGSTSSTIRMRMIIPAAIPDSNTRVLFGTGRAVATYPANSWGIYLSPTTGLHYREYDASNTILTPTANTAFLGPASAIGRPLDLVVVHNKTGGRIIGYLDGVQTFDVADAGVDLTTGQIRLGRDSGSQYVNMVVLEAAVIRAALTAAEVQALHRDGWAAVPQHRAAIEAWWLFDASGAGLQERDRSGSSHPLTLSTTGANRLDRGERIRVTTTCAHGSAGDLQLTGQAVLPDLGWRLVGVTAKASAAVTIQLGSTSGGADVVSSTALSSGVVTPLSIASSTPPTVNVWSNASAAASIVYTLEYSLTKIT